MLPVLGRPNMKIGVGFDLRLELPSIDDNVDSGGTIGTIEAVKTVADVYTPVKGKIIEINENIVDQPELINSSPYNDGWIACIEFDVSIDEVKTLSSEEYLKFIGK